MVGSTQRRKKTVSPVRFLMRHAYLQYTLSKTEHGASLPDHAHKVAQQSFEQKADLVLLADWLAGCSSKGLGIHDAAVQIVKGTKQAHSVLLQLACKPCLHSSNTPLCHEQSTQVPTKTTRHSPIRLEQAGNACRSTLMSCRMGC